MSSIAHALLCGAPLLLAGAFAPLGAQSSPAPQRWAYVDTRAIIEAAPGRADADATLQKESVAWQAQITRMQDSMNTMIAEFQKASASMTPAAKERRTKEIQAKQDEFQKRNGDINAEAQKRQGDLMQPILDQIKQVLEDTRQAMGLSAIFDIGQNATIVAVDKNLNITDRVIARLRLLPAPVPSTKAEAPTSAVPSPSKPASKAPSGLPIGTPAGVGRPAPARVDTNTVRPPAATPPSA
jgi:outer membrane protein